MQRKPGFPVANCSIKMPDSIPSPADNVGSEEVTDQMRQRQQLINFGHSQWGFNNWSWSVTKQDLDFVDFSNGKYAAGVAAFVSVSVRPLEIHRENVGYATSVAPMKGSAIYQARKGSVTNALKETLLSFGGSVTTELLELLESQKLESTDPLPPQQEQENNQNMLNKPMNESKNINKGVRKEENREVQVRPHIGQVKSAPMPPVVTAPALVAKAAPPPIAKAAPMSVTVPPAANKMPLPANQPRLPPPPQPRPPSNTTDPKPLENMTEEEMRVERKRRQRQAQEEFRLKQMQKQNPDKTDPEKRNRSTTEKQELHKTAFETFLMDIPTQDIMIEETGACADVEGHKRKSPEPHNGGSCKKRPGTISKLDILQSD